MASDKVGQCKHKLPLGTVAKTIEGSSLSAEQAEAVVAAACKSDLVVIEGAAGSGKSYALKNVAQLYKAEGYRVLGSATAWKVAEELGEACDIESCATDSWLAQAVVGRNFLDAKTLLIVDEAGQLSSRQMHQILERAEAAGAKVILTGDQKQLQAIAAGPGLRLVAEQTGVTRIDIVRRQEENWAREAVLDFADGRAEKALTAFDQHGLLSMVDGQSETLKAAVNAWVVDHRLYPTNTSLVMAQTNREVASLNVLMRDSLKAKGKLGSDLLELSVAGGKTLPLARGECLRFTKRIEALGVVNGSLATVENIMNPNSNNPSLVLKQASRTLTVSISDLNGGRGAVPFKYAYASTLYAAQGATVDRAYIVASPRLKRNDMYVATSRAKKSTRVFVNTDAVRRLMLDGKLLTDRAKPEIGSAAIKHYLGKAWSRVAEKVSALDHLPKQEHQRRHVPVTSRMPENSLEL
mgnify:CR=1 FL=1